MKTIVSTIIAILFVTALLIFKHIGEASYSFLFALISLIAIVIQLFPRLKELDFKNLKLVLSEIKEAKEELYAREEDFKKISHLFLLILSYSTVTQGRWGSKDSAELQRKWFEQKIDCLSDALEYSNEEKSEIKKYIDKYNEYDSLMKGRGALQTTDPDYEDTKKKLELISNELLLMLKHDVEKNV
jgi:hypothetical protein